MSKDLALSSFSDEELKILYKKTLNDVSRYHNLQLAKKIQLNSAYGALGNKFFRWFDIRHAEAITKSGQLSIQWIMKEINQYLNKICKTNGVDYVIASDTDSIYVSLDNLVTLVYGSDRDDLSKIVDFVDSVCKLKLEPFIDSSYSRLAEMMSAREQKMKMKRESIADKGIWTAKKRYILNVWDVEGVRYSTPKIKTVGIETVRSSTPMVVRDALKEALSVIMNGTEEDLQSFILTFKSKFQRMRFEEVAFPRGISGIDKYRDSSSVYKSGTPIQVKGALIYNKVIRDLGVDRDYAQIKDGDKIKFAYLKMPNSFKSEVISLPSHLPETVQDLANKYVDRDLQFQKTFLDPLQNILGVIGWESEKRSTLSDFF